MTTSFNLSSEKGFEDLNALLLNQTFIVGHEPSNVDLSVYKIIVDKKLEQNAKKLTNVSRWFETIAAYSNHGDDVVVVPQSSLEFTVDEDEFDLFDHSDLPEKKTSSANTIRSTSAPKKVNKQRSEVVMEVKTWNETISMKDVEEAVRSIEMEGLVWGTSTLIPQAFLMYCLSIKCIVDDDLVSVQDLEDTITSMDDLVQSVDIISFNTYR